MPRYLHLTDAFPMTVIGKVQTFVMRDASVSIFGLEAAAAARTASSA